MRIITVILVVLFSVPMLAVAQSSHDGKISGVVYADYFYNVARDTNFAALSNTALGGGKDLNGFKLRRVYFTYDKPLTESFSMRFRLEVDESANASNGKIGNFVKDAYLKWKGIFSGSDLVFGLQPTPAYELSENVWGYRSLEKTVMDLRGIVSSRDQGVALQGNLMSDGKLKYKVMYGNGSGNNPETNKYKRYYGRVEALMIENTTISLYADLNARSPLTTATGSLSNNTLTYAGFVGYKVKDAFTVGAEAYVQSTQNGFLQGTTYSDRSGLGLSFFGTVVMNPTMSVIGRVDTFDPNTDGASKSDARLFALAGFDWHPEGNVSVIPNIMLETYDAVAGVSIDPSLTARITFTYSY